MHSIKIANSANPCDVDIEFINFLDQDGPVDVKITLSRQEAKRFCAGIQEYIAKSAIHGDAFMHILSRWSLIIGSLPDTPKRDRAEQLAKVFREDYRDFPWDVYAVKYWLHQGD